MTDLQREAVRRNPNVMIFHMMLMHGESNDDDDQERQYASLGEEWDTLHDSIPAMKYTRIVTAEEVRPGEYLFMCSCGFDFRYQGTCRHISLLLLHASNGECAGCEIGNIALRNTAAFAACRDAKLIQRSPGDWKGVHCSHVTEESLLNCPQNGRCDDRDDDHDDQDDGHDDDHGARSSARQVAKKTEWRQRRDARMTLIQDHYYRLQTKLKSCGEAEFFELAEKVDGHILAAWRELSDVQDVPQSTVANRYPSDPKRGQRPKTPPSKRAAAPPPKRPAATGGSAAVRTTPASHTAASPRHVVIVLSDSDDERELRNGGASSSD